MSGRKELLERLQHVIAAEPELQDAPNELVERIRKEAGVISNAEVLSVLRHLRNETHGLGQLESLLASPGVTDIVVNGPHDVFVDRGDGLLPASPPVDFTDDAAVRRLAVRLAVSCGSRLDDAQPFANGRIPRADGTSLRIHAVLSPPAGSGTCLSIRVLRQQATSLGALVANGTLPQDIAQLLQAMVERRVSFLVIGGTGSGKTTLLAALLGTVPDTERILTIEDTAELRPQHPHVVSLLSRGKNTEGRGEITMSELLRQALRMRPDRIVVGEIRGQEVVDLLASLNTGHDGGAGTLHANSLTEVPARMEALAALGGLGREALHAQLAAAVDAVLTMHRGPDGRRRLVEIGLLTGNPVTAHVIWSAEDGPQPGFAEFRSRVEGGGQ